MSASSKLTTLLQRHQIQSSNHLKQIHSFLITSGLSNDTLLLTKILHSPILYHTNNLAYTSLLFYHVNTPNNINPWNAIVRGFATSSQPHLSLAYYAKMRRNGVDPNEHTFPLLFKSFSKSKTGNPFQVYGHVFKYGLDFENFIRNSLISAFANCGYVEFARQVFDESSQRDAVAWTAMMDGYVKNGCPEEGLKCFLWMRSVGVKVDEVTVVSALHAAGMVRDVWFGRWVHGFYVESGRVKWDVYVGSALVDVYMKCCYWDDAHKVFNEMPIKNVVLCSTLIAGYVQLNRFKDGLIAFQDMLMHGVKPNQITLTSVLTACAQLGALDQGRWVHGYIDRNALEMNPILGTALIDMYAKCGCIDEAFSVFDKLPMKAVYPWTAMIIGLAMHGDALGTLDLFSRMSSCRIQPNEVTFIGVLSACSHGGLVDEGRKFFRLMRHKYNLEPNVDHYGCMVDLLGRAGHLEEACKLIEEMPMEPTPGVWGALFGACMIHKAFELGEYVGNHLIRLQPNHSGRYTLLANIYSASRKWDAAAHVRKLMKGNGIGKTPGFSWIEVTGLIHEFIAFDKSHSESNDLYEMLHNIMLQLKPADYFLENILLLYEG